MCAGQCLRDEGIRQGALASVERRGAAVRRRAARGASEGSKCWAGLFCSLPCALCAPSKAGLGQGWAERRARHLRGVSARLGVLASWTRRLAAAVDKEAGGWRPLLESLASPLPPLRKASALAVGGWPCFGVPAHIMRPLLCLLNLPAPRSPCWSPAHSPMLLPDSACSKLSRPCHLLHSPLPKTQCNQRDGRASREGT